MDQLPPVIVHSDGEINRHLNSGVAPAVIHRKIRGDFSASEYQKIVDAVAEENQQRGRSDAIINRRFPPYKPLPTLRVWSVRLLKEALQTWGTTFICIIESDMEQWNNYTYHSMITMAHERGMEVIIDEWNE